MSDSETPFSKEYIRGDGTGHASVEARAGAFDPEYASFTTDEEIEPYGVSKPKRWVLRVRINSDAG